MEHRYDAAALCEQSAIPVYLLLRNADRLMVIGCRILHHESEARDYLRTAIRQAYVNPNHVLTETMPTEIVRADRSLDFLRGKEGTADSTLVLSVPAFQAAHGPGNSFESTLQMIMCGLVQANYRSEVTVWGCYGQSTSSFPAYYFSITPFRNHSYVKVFKELLAGRWHEELAGDVLRDGAVPLVKWSPKEEQIRLWAEPAKVPDFSLYRPDQRADASYVQRAAVAQFAGQNSLLVGKGTFSIQHRLCQVEWVRS